MAQASMDSVWAEAPTGGINDARMIRNPNAGPRILILFATLRFPTDYLLTRVFGIDLPPENWSRCNVRLGPQRGGHMARNRHTAEQIINKLREAEVGLSQGQTVAQVSRGMGVSEQTFYRWRNEYGGLKIDQVKRLKQLETENTRLKRAVADLTLDNQILREAAEGNF